MKLADAMRFLQQGRLSEAAAACRAILALQPRDVAVLQVLAVVEAQRKEYQESLRLFAKAIRIAPDQPSLFSNRSSVMYASGQFENAIQDARRAIALKPGFAEAYFNLGNALRALEKFQEALSEYDSALSLNPGYVKALVGRGLAAFGLRRFDEAIGAYQRALELSPSNVEAAANLGAALYAAKRYEDSLQCVDRALNADPRLGKAWLTRANVLRNLNRLEEAEHAARKAVDYDRGIESHEALAAIFHAQMKLDDAERELRSILEERIESAGPWNLLGLVLRDKGALPDAAACCIRATQLKPDFFEAFANLSVIYREGLNLGEAEINARKAVEINPDFGEGHINLGVVLREAGKLSEAHVVIERGLELSDRAEARANLVGVLNELGRSEEALENARRTVRECPETPAMISTYLWAAHYHPGVGLVRGGIEEAERYGRLLRSKVSKKFEAFARVETSRLKVGFVSGDLCNHPVGFFLEAMLGEMDRDRVELVGYPTRAREDDLTDRIRPYFSKWHSLVGLSDEEAARRIHEDGVHVLIDLAGHTAANRLPVFAYKPAPVQATWLGYFATTGVKEIDYIIGDPYVTPESEADHFVEKIWALPETYCCFSPPRGAPQVTALPALANGFVTFGCFNNLAKVNERVIALWARVLQAVPGSKLLLKTKALADETVKARIRGQFQERGIEADRLILEGPAPRTELLGAYGRVDIALDPFPYPGGTTSAEALWMGVPVLTKRGDRFLSHVGETIAHNSGQSEWIAQDEAEYVQKAVQFTQDLQSLAARRAQMREKLLQSPLYDAQRFARHFEQALWGMWRGC